MVRAWVNHYGAMYAALKALHDLARRWIWSGEASSSARKSHSGWTWPVCAVADLHPA